MQLLPPGHHTNVDMYQLYIDAAGRRIITRAEKVSPSNLEGVATVGSPWLHLIKTLNPHYRLPSTEQVENALVEHVTKNVSISKA